MRQDLASCIVFPDVSECFLGILPEPPEHSHPVGFLLFMSVLWHTRYCLGRVGFVAVCSIVVYIRVLQGTVPQPTRFSVASHTADRLLLLHPGGAVIAERLGFECFAHPTRHLCHLDSLSYPTGVLFGTEERFPALRDRQPCSAAGVVIFLVLGVCCAHHWNSWADPIRREAIPLAKAVRQTHS